MKFPSNDKIDFLICDDVREETSYKLTLVGFFPTPEIWLDQESTPPFNFPISFLFVLKDGFGDYTASCRLIDPIGNELFEYDLGNFEQKQSEPQIVALNIPTLTISELGKYKIILTLNHREFERTFNIGKRRIT
jgi:hypothetical protein